MHSGVCGPGPSKTSLSENQTRHRWSAGRNVVEDPLKHPVKGSTEISSIRVKLAKDFRLNDNFKTLFVTSESMTLSLGTVHIDAGLPPIYTEHEIPSEIHSTTNE